MAYNAIRKPNYRVMPQCLRQYPRIATTWINCAHTIHSKRRSFGWQSIFGQAGSAVYTNEKCASRFVGITRSVANIQRKSQTKSCNF